MFIERLYRRRRCHLCAARNRSLERTGVSGQLNRPERARELYADGSEPASGSEEELSLSVSVQRPLRSETMRWQLVELRCVRVSISISTRASERASTSTLMNTANQFQRSACTHASSSSSSSYNVLHTIALCSQINLILVSSVVQQQMRTILPPLSAERTRVHLRRRRFRRLRRLERRRRQARWRRRHKIKSVR